MTLSNIDKNHLNKLMEIPNLNELQQVSIIQSIQRNSNNYSKLKVLFKQLENIKAEIQNVILESIETENLQKVKCNFKKIPGKNYYLYQRSNNDCFFSMLSPEEWKNNHIFLGEYFYDFDHNFQKV